MKSEFPNLPQSGTDPLGNPPILYYRGGMIVRDPARADTETPSAVRELALTVRLIGAAAVLGVILGELLR